MDSTGPCPILLGRENIWRAGINLIGVLVSSYLCAFLCISLILVCDQLEGGFCLLTFPLLAVPPLGHRDLGPQSRELALKVLRSSSCGDSEYGAGRSTSG